MADTENPQSTTEDSASGSDDGERLFHQRKEGEEPASRNLEIIAAVLLSITVILTAWSAFQSSKWGGAMSISFSEASSARIQANRAAGEAAQAQQIDLTLYSQWFQATVNGNTKAADYVEERFPARFKVPFEEWVKLGGITDPKNAPPGPFALDSYVPPGAEESKELDVRADAKFQEALRNNQRGDNYTVLGVLFAVVLFFAAIATRFTNRRVSIGLLTMAGIGFLLGATFLLGFPKLV